MRCVLMDREVDRLLRRPRGWAKRLALRGLIPHIRLPDGEIIFDPIEIEQFLSAHMVQPVKSEVATANA
jgi:hypothetical protein